MDKKELLKRLNELRELYYGTSSGAFVTALDRLIADVKKPNNNRQRLASILKD